MAGGSPSRTLRALFPAALLLLAALGGGSPALGAKTRPAAKGKPRASARREVVEVRLVQVDISVLAPGSGSHASVPGLGLDAFEVRLDGKRIDDKENSGLLFDTFCGEEGKRPDAGVPPGATATGPAGERRIIAVVDFNYLDARARFRVAGAIDAIAEEAGKGPEIYKIYGLTRQVYELTGGFTRDSEELRHVAALIRSTSHRGGEFVRPGEEGIPEIQAINLFDEIRATGPLGVSLTPGESGFSAAVTLSDLYLESRSAYDPGASLAALEAILRANSAWPGRKAVILFTSEAFRMLREERIGLATRGLKEMFRHGFTVWTVDAEGLSREASSRSRLLSMIARESGGDSVRRTGNLETAFRGASEQLSCYYLLSVPVPVRPGTPRRHSLTVKFDTVEHPELWAYRIIAADEVWAVDRAARRRSQRMAALFSPQDFGDPPVDLALGYPVAKGGKRVMPVSLRVPLSALEWSVTAGRSVQAGVLVDLIVERDTGRSTEPVCKIGPEDLPGLNLKLGRMPRRDQAADLVFELSCDLPRDGLYTARGVVTDLASYDSGAAMRSAQIAASLGGKWSVPVARVQASSGKDLVWRPGATSVRRDRERRSWRELTPDGQVEPGDRVGLRYVICGPDRSEARQRYRHLLMRVVDPDDRKLQMAFEPEAAQVLGEEGEGPFCAPAMVVVPEYSLPPGDYEWLITEPGYDPAKDSPGASEGDETDRESRPHVVQRVPFTVSK